MIDTHHCWGLSAVHDPRLTACGAERLFGRSDPDPARKGTAPLAPGDMMPMPDDTPYGVVSSLTGGASHHHGVANKGPAGATWTA